MLSHVLLISSAYLAYAFMMSRKLPGGGASINVPAFSSTRQTVFVTHPDVHMRRFETVLPSVYDEAELTFNGDGRHLSPSTWGAPAMCSVYRTATHAVKALIVSGRP